MKKSAVLFFAVIVTAGMTVPSGYASDDLASKFNDVLSQVQAQKDWQINAADVYAMIQQKSRISSLCMSGQFLQDSMVERLQDPYSYLTMIS